MGLAIQEYSYSYTTLHELRAFALAVEGNTKSLEEIYSHLKGKISIEDRSAVTKYYAFIHHSDWDGGYISFSYFHIKEQNPETVTDWDDLDELKREVEELNPHKDRLEGEVLEAWEDLYTDVTEADTLLEFA